MVPGAKFGQANEIDENVAEVRTHPLDQLLNFRKKIFVFAHVGILLATLEVLFEGPSEFDQFIVL